MRWRPAFAQCSLVARQARVAQLWDISRVHSAPWGLPQLTQHRPVQRVAARILVVTCAAKLSGTLDRKDPAYSMKPYDPSTAYKCASAAGPLA